MAGGVGGRGNGLFLGILDQANQTMKNSEQNSPWSIRLTAVYDTEVDPQAVAEGFNVPMLSFAGTGCCTIDWGDGTVQEHCVMVPTKEGEDMGDYGHVYKHFGKYRVRVTGEGEESKLRLFACYCVGELEEGTFC